jgi:hypothetical protein
MRSGIVVLLLAILLGSWWHFRPGRHHPKVSFERSSGTCSVSQKNPHIRVDSHLAGSIDLISKDDNYSVLFTNGVPLNVPSNPFSVLAGATQTYSTNQLAKTCVSPTVPGDDKCPYRFTVTDLDHPPMTCDPTIHVTK